jgi:FtsP/CotA-like multicopper oxidase with cupredoxin domain
MARTNLTIARRRVSHELAHLSLTQRLALAAAVMAALLGLLTWVSLAPAAGDEPQLREFTLTAEEIEWELQSGTTVRAWTYNGTLPGPEIRVREGDHVKITLVNHLPVATTIHWHGLNVPPEQDGPAGLNQAPVEPGQSFTYDWIATPAGTRWYHAHTDVATQVMLGLYGSLIVEPRTGGTHYDRDYTYLLSEWDSELTPDVATGRAPRGPRDQTLRGGEFGTDLFLMNGKIHEGIPPIVVTEGDEVLIRLINAGTLAHPFHTHGHSFRIVATDGNPVPKAAQLTKDTVWIAPGERYDLVFTADNPGVWMTHCHIEHHAANGMMTVIQYEGAEPTGPLKEFWALTPAADGQQAPPDHGGGQGHGTHSMQGPQETAATPDSSPPAATTATASPTIDPAATWTPQPTATAGEPAPSTATTAAGGDDVVWLAMEDDRFNPKTITIAAGKTVTWINKGADWHSVASFDGSFESAQVASGETFSHTFTTPGIYKFICKHHARQGMIGEIVVTE